MFLIFVSIWSGISVMIIKLVGISFILRGVISSQNMVIHTVHQSSSHMDVTAGENIIREETETEQVPVKKGAGKAVNMLQA